MADINSIVVPSESDNLKEVKPSITNIKSGDGKNSVPVTSEKFKYNKIVLMGKDGTLKTNNISGRKGKASSRDAWIIGNNILGPRGDELNKSICNIGGDDGLVDYENNNNYLNSIYKMKEDSSELEAEESVISSGNLKSTVPENVFLADNVLITNGHKIGSRNLLSLRDKVVASDDSEEEGEEEGEEDSGAENP